MATHKQYGGKHESPEKIRVRATSYAMCGKALWNLIHIVIASVDCGDIKFLLSLNVDARNIIACDIDPAARAAAALFGVRVSPHARIEDTVAWAIKQGYKIGSINVDLCETTLTCAPIMQAVYGTIQQAGIRCNLFYTFQRGRDRTLLNKFPGLSPDGARRVYLQVHASIPHPDDTDTYTSYTRDGHGSAMGVYRWKVAGRPGRKQALEFQFSEPRVEKQARQYRCHACTKMGPHPATHLKEHPECKVLLGYR